MAVRFITARITQGREIDAVVELPDSRWCAFEIKLGANQIDAAAQNLLSLKKFFENDPKGKPPAILCGLTSAAYQRPDGVFVVPITAFKELIGQNGIEKAKPIFR